MGPRLRLGAAHVELRTLRHGFGRPADRIGHVEVRDRQREWGGVDGTGSTELAPGRRLDRVETLEPRAHLEQAAAQLPETVVRQAPAERVRERTNDGPVLARV